MTIFWFFGGQPSANPQIAGSVAFDISPVGSTQIPVGYMYGGSLQISAYPSNTSPISGLPYSVDLTQLSPDSEE